MIRLFYQSRQSPPVVDVVQYNTIISLDFFLADFVPPPGCTARIFVQKPSGHTVFNDCAIDGNNVTVQPTTQMFSEPGKNPAQIILFQGEKMQASFPFVFAVYENLAAEAEQSTDESVIKFPIATSDTVGGVTADPKTDAQTMPVGIDPKTGRLYTESGGAGYPLGNGLKVVDGKLTVDTADAVEQDNTRPVTSAAVYTEVGNIEVLLANI